MDLSLHPAATGQLPWFITPPGSPDILFYIVVVFLVAAVLFVGNVYFQLHALPERISHRTNKVQVELVAVLALLALFTHEHIFWIAALLLALVELPDFSTPINSIAGSLERLAQSAMGREQAPSGTGPPPPPAAEDEAPAPAPAAAAAAPVGPTPPSTADGQPSQIDRSDQPSRGE